MSAEVVAALQGVRRGFEDGAGRREVLRGVDLKIRAGELVALVGPSGCGKTTLLSILGALDAGFEGTVEVLGEDLGKLNDDALTRLRCEEIGIVFQSFHLLDHLTVVENVELPMWLTEARTPRETARRRALEALERVGLSGREDDAVPSMSGGERQRVAIARALVNRPRLLLADEPTGNLDAAAGDQVFSIFEKIRTGSDDMAPCAVVVATHDPRVESRARRVIRVSEGRLAASEAEAVA